jgi:hypothetical protein
MAELVVPRSIPIVFATVNPPKLGFGVVSA